MHYGLAGINNRSGVVPSNNYRFCRFYTSKSDSFEVISAISAVMGVWKRLKKSQPRLQIFVDAVLTARDAST